MEKQNKGLASTFQVELKQFSISPISHGSVFEVPTKKVKEK